MKTEETQTPNCAVESIDHVAAKLRESQKEDEQQLVKSGHEAGRQYVLRNPRYAELRRLSSWQGSLGLDIHRVMDQMPLLTVAEIMTGDRDEAREIESELREDHGADVGEATWVVAFVDAVIETFAELQNAKA